MTDQEPVLLLHGQPGGAGDWDAVLAAIAGRVPAIAIDRPGYDGHNAAGGIEHSARVALARLDAEGIGRATLVGLSFGGAVAAWIAAHHPDRVSSLVLISPAANTDALVAADRLLAAPLIGPVAGAGLLVGAGLLSFVHPLRQRAARSWGIPEPHLRRTGAKLLNRETLRTFVVEQRALLTELPRLEAALGAISAPTTIVLGTRDPIVPPAANRRLAQQIRSACLVEIDGGRHSLSVTHPAAIAEAIVDASTGTVERRSRAPSRERQQQLQERRRTPA